MTRPTLAERIDALSRALPLARDRLPGDDIDTVAAIIDKAGARLRHGTDHTVVALVGPTGVGKSSLFNALCGADISAVGVRRPTTAATHACVWGDGGGALLDWMEVGRRHHLTAGDDDPLAGLVLLDLPDFDSTAGEHRLEVDRLVELVDLLVWVNDPQKYADDALHRGYLAPLAGHAPVMRFVVNKVDTLAPLAAAEVVADFARRLADDGIGEAEIITASITDGTGVAELRQLLAAEVTARAAAVDRVDADLRAGADRLSSSGSATGISRSIRTTLVEQLGHAAGIDGAADLVAAQHRRDARRAVSWPPVRWLRRWGREPIADLPRVGASPVATAEIATALREVGEGAADGLAAPWTAATRRAAQAQLDDVVHELTAVTRTTVTGLRRRPRWWGPVAALQRLSAAIALVGIAWLLGLAVLGGFFRLDTDPLTIDTPGADWIPLPSALLLGAVAASVLVTVGARGPAALAARRHARHARRQLRSRVAEVADDHVLSRVAAVLQDHEELEALLLIARAGP